MSDGIELSIVIPAYNEAEVIGDTIARVSAYLAANGSHELLVVDDGSSDATAAIVEAFAADHPNVRLVRNPGTAARATPSATACCTRAASTSCSPTPTWSTRSRA